ncbi:hypothetical protein C0J52_00581 [Blattella germanica]|nr:hypothetical protein C0J52_00581 [Blattella germanica]
MNKLVMSLSFLLLVIAVAQVSAQTCTLKAENTACLRGLECCSSCCLSGVCSNAGHCYDACNTTVSTTSSAATVCDLEQKVNHLFGTAESIVDNVLNKLMPVLDGVKDIIKNIATNPFLAITQASQLMAQLQSVFGLFGSSATGVQTIFQDISAIITDIVKVLSSVVIQSK